MIIVRVTWRQCWLLLSMVSVSAYPRQAPNIVFFMVDDMGWNDVSFHGSDQILTPNIDTLAYQGVILQQYYSEAICTPARTALLTGKYPMRLGMHGTPLFNSEDRGIPLTERLLPSYLKELGYATHLVGKWHVGMSKQEFLPTSRGYDTHYGMRGGFIDYYTYNKVEMWPNGRELFGLDLYDGPYPQTEEDRYIVDALTDRAIKVIQHHNSSCPLFLHITHNAPHAGNDGAPLQPPLYSPIKHRHIAHSDRRLYAEVVTQIDRSIGQIVQALSQNNLLDDTLIIFASDNGSPTVGTFRNWGVNLPLRGIKYTPWEGAVRVPAFIWHASFRPRVWNGLMHISDWLPTLAAAAGGRIETQIDGVSQWNAIVQDGLSQRKEVLIAIEDSDRNVYAAYRAGDYKIIVGNVTGLNNGYYGAELLANRGPTQDYYPALMTSDVARTFEEMGVYLDVDDIQAMRVSATLKQEDPVRDQTPCEPTLNRGCLFNVRRDPSEQHNIWQRATNIATLLTSRLRGLWAMQQRRGPLNLQNESDPVNFGYNWQPWINEASNNAIQRYKNTDSLNLSVRVSANGTSSRDATYATAINCNGTTGLRNFLCLLKSIF